MRWSPSVVAFARADRRRRADHQDALYQDTEPARRVADEVAAVGAGAAARLRRARGAARRRSTRASSASRGPGGKTTALRAGACRGQQVLDAHAGARRARSRTSSATPTPTSRRACATSWRPRSTPTKRPRRASARSTSSTCWCARAIWCATARDVRAAFQRALHAPVRRRVPGHRSAAGRDPAAARGRRRRRDATGARCGPSPGKLFVVGDPKQSIYRFRRADVGIYEAVREQLRRHGARVRRAAQQLPRRARHPARRERRVRAADDRRRRRRAGALRAAGAGAAGPARASRRSSRCRCRRPKLWNGAPTKASLAEGAAATRSPPSSTGSCSDERLDGDRSRAADRARADRGARRVPAVPALRHADVRRADGRRDAAVRPGARGARLAAPARRRQELPRARGGRDAAHRARRDRVAGRRAVGLRHAARRAVRVRRRRAARLPRPRQYFHPFRPLEPPERLRTLPRASICEPMRRPDGAADVAAALRLLRICTAQPAPGGGDDRGAARRVARARDFRAAAVGRAGARQRPVRRRAGAPVRGGRRAVVPRLRRAAARRGRGDAGRRSADPRGGERRRPADDRAQGEGPRVPGRRAGRHRRRAVAQHRVPLGRQRGFALRGQPGRLGARGAAAARADRGGARRGRRRPRGLRRRHARPRSAGRVRRRRPAV